MVKPFVFVRDERYFIARCPETKEIWDAIQAPQKALARRLVGSEEWNRFMSCLWHPYIRSLKIEPGIV
jgi:hypothetical protein